MSVNTNFNPQSSSNPVAGGYIQPGAGVTGAVVSPSDVGGNAYATANASNGTANLQTINYRDSIITVQASSSAAAPGALGTVATCTPGTAGLWEVSGTVSISGTTVAANETNNMQLRQTATARLTNIPIGVTSTTGSAGAVPFGPVILNLGGSDTVNVVAVNAATGSSIYGAQIICRRVG